jgi:hypothetical protein
MPASPRDPLAGVERLIVDGTNLLYRLGRIGAAPPAAAIGRLRAAIPAPIQVVLVFDGPPDQGGALGKVAQGMTVRYSGRRPADTVIHEVVGASALAGPFAAAKLLVVTDDNALRRIIAKTGARTTDTWWLVGRLDRSTLASAAPGNRRPPPPPPPGSTPGASDEEPDAAVRRWRPGRGATRKVGNPRRRRLPR